MAKMLRLEGADSQGHSVTVDVTVPIGLAPGSNIQAALNANDIVYLGPGEHRITAPLTIPRQGQTLFLTEGARLIGSRRITNWVSDGVGRWSAAGWLPAAYSGEGTCTVIAGVEANPCKFRESLYMGGFQLKRRMVLADLQVGEYHADYSANKIYVKDNPALHQWELLRTNHAINSTQTDFRLLGDGGVIEGFASPAQLGAVTAQGARWEISGLTFTRNHGSGFHFIRSHETWLHDCIFTRNEQMGWTHYDSDFTVAEHLWVEQNNPKEEFWVLDWESAGTKYSFSKGCRIEDCDFVGNHGVSIWLDIDWEEMIVRNNRVSNSSSCGVRAEIGFAAVIENNTINGTGEAHGRLLNRNNVIDTGPFATAGIMVNCSQNVSVLNNTVSGTVTPIEIVQRRRTPQYSSSWPDRMRAIKNCRVEDNEVWVATGGFTGVGQLDEFNTIDPYYGKAWGNTAARNIYHIPSLTTNVFHMWETSRNQLRNFNKWKQLMEPTAIEVVG